MVWYRVPTAKTGKMTKKRSLSGKHGNLICSSCNSLILKVKDISNSAVKIFNFFLKLDKSAN